MNNSFKLGLDIVLGAVAPILILKYGTAPLGTLPAYLVAAMVPVGWVTLDLLVITRRFNFITSYVGFTAILRGALAFWYVDGQLWAIKDTISYMVAAVVFGGSAFLSKPVTRAIGMQGLVPETPEQANALEGLLDERPVLRALRQSAVIIGVTNLLCGVANYIINLRMVVAPFNTPAFNDQVANVNAITRVALMIPDMLALFWAFSLMYKAIYKLLPKSSSTVENENFWDLVAERELILASGGVPVGTGDGSADFGDRKAKEEFGLL